MSLHALQPIGRARQPVERPSPDMVWIPGGTFRMGSDCHYPEESPAHLETVEGFWMDAYAVTNAEFAHFVDSTGYVTLAEKPARAEDYPGARPELLAPSSVVFRKPPGRVDIRNHYNWWGYVQGANWRSPEGSGSSVLGRENHPVVHVAYEDVEAYAKWLGKDLPSEAEWEFAARGGLNAATYAWGEEFAPGGKQMAKTWQGEFPWQNALEDGFESTAPVGLFPPNGYGLYDMIGNVWEWTSDWYSARHNVARPCCGNLPLKGGIREQSFDPQTPNLRIPRKVIKGGSFLCAPNYCRRYRPAARMAQPVDTSACHVGFRLIVRAKAHAPLEEAERRIETHDGEEPAPEVSHRSYVCSQKESRSHGAPSPHPPLPESGTKKVRNLGIRAFLSSTSLTCDHLSPAGGIFP